MSQRKFKQKDPHYGVVQMLQEICLRGNQAQSLLGHFHRANTALYYLDVRLPQRIGVEQAAELKSAVYGVIRQLEENLQPEYVRVNLLHEKCSKIPVVHSSKPLKTTVKLAHPDSQRLLDLLVGFDQIYYKLTGLWFARQIDSRTYFKVSTDCRTVLKEGLKAIVRNIKPPRTHNDKDPRQHPQKR